MILAAPILFACTVAYVVDGDTLACRDGTRVRLAAIDAPELRGCRRGRICAPGDPHASKRALEALVAGRALRCEHVGWSWRRRVAWCSTAAGDLSCAMMRQGAAAYVPAL